MNTAVPFQAQKPIFHKLENIADMAKLTREEREYYHISLDSLRTNLAVMDHERNVARAEGLEEGRAVGLEEGRAEGRKEERQSMVISLLQIGALSVEQIAAVTKLTIEEVENIKSSL